MKTNKYSSKSVRRCSVRDLSDLVRIAERDAEFWFKHRHNWSEENGGYDYCRKHFLRSCRNRRTLQRLLVNAAERYVGMYVK